MSIRQRIDAIRRRNFPWWDWGQRAMILVGREHCGSYDVPRPRDMWFRDDAGKLTTTYDYSDVLAKNDGEWRVFDSQNDGFEVKIGYWPHPNGDGHLQLSGLDGRHEQRLFLRWFVWDGRIKAEWFGVRRWLYYKALRAAIAQKKPFTCQLTPPAGSGGYDHWHCGLPRRHEGPHRFHNYTWDPAGAAVQYAPTDVWGR